MIEVGMRVDGFDFFRGAAECGLGIAVLVADKGLFGAEAFFQCRSDRCA